MDDVNTKEEFFSRRPHGNLFETDRKCVAIRTD